MSTSTLTDQGSPTRGVPDITPHDSLFNFKTGDVQIIVAYEGKRLLGVVSSNALILASPVWNKFINPPWEDVLESTMPPKQKTIDCTEDNANSLLVLLNIAHMKFNSVPTLLSYQELFNVAVLVDQYQCVELVTPWLVFWICNEVGQSQKNRTGRMVVHCLGVWPREGI